jgi:hypothetical protein
MVGGFDVPRYDGVCVASICDSQLARPLSSACVVAVREGLSPAVGTHVRRISAEEVGDAGELHQIECAGSRPEYLELAL